jgi:hypothetical protein
MILLDVLAIVKDRDDPPTVAVKPVTPVEGSTSSSRVMIAVSPSEGISIEETVGAVVSGTATVLLFVADVVNPTRALEDASVTLPEA